jgi:Tol biopolymer transport system component
MKVNETRQSVDIWRYGLPAATPTRLTSSGLASYPLWAPDRQHVTVTQRVPDRGIFAVPIGGGRPQPTIVPMEGVPEMTAASWSPDGKWLAYLQAVTNVAQIFVQPIANGKAAGEPRQLAPSSYSQQSAEFSPDGRWIAYNTSEAPPRTGEYVEPVVGSASLEQCLIARAPRGRRRLEGPRKLAHLARFMPFKPSSESGATRSTSSRSPVPGEKRRVSLDGGRDPAWSRNGREIYYLKASRPGSNAVMAANISTAGEASGHRVLFEGPCTGSNPLRSYDVTAGHKGQRTAAAQSLPILSICRRGELRRITGSGGQVQCLVPR